MPGLEAHTLVRASSLCITSRSSFSQAQRMPGKAVVLLLSHGLTRLTFSLSYLEIKSSFTRSNKKGRKERKKGREGGREEKKERKKGRKRKKESKKETY